MTTTAATPADAAPPSRQLVWDVTAYLALAAAVAADPDAARARAAARAAESRAAGLEPAVSPLVLWALLAECIEAPPPEGASARRRAAPTVADAATRPHAAARLARARAALAACVAHATPAGAPAGAAPTLAIDAELVLCRVAAGRDPQGHAAWLAYLTSLAAELAVAPTVEQATRVAGPLAHVRERAVQVLADHADEVQEVVVAGFDAAAALSGWEEADAVAARQGLVVSRVEAIDRAIVAGRVDRAWTLVGGAGRDDDAGEASEARVAEACPAGVRLWREVVRALVAGTAEPGGRAWDRTLWGMQLAFPVGLGDLAVVETADPVLLEAAERGGLQALVRRAAP